MPVYDLYAASKLGTTLALLVPAATPCGINLAKLLSTTRLDGSIGPTDGNWELIGFKKPDNTDLAQIATYSFEASENGATAEQPLPLPVLLQVSVSGAAWVCQATSRPLRLDTIKIASQIIPMAATLPASTILPVLVTPEDGRLLVYAASQVTLSVQIVNYSSDYLTYFSAL